MLEILFSQAEAHHKTTNLDNKTYESRMLKGIQIVREKKTKEIKIYNPRGMDYYDEISTEQYELFKGGWMIGVWKMKLDSYKDQLEQIEQRMKTERNSTRSSKSLENFKIRKKQILNKYYEVTQKLNRYEK